MTDEECAERIIQMCKDAGHFKVYYTKHPNRDVNFMAEEYAKDEQAFKCVLMKAGITHDT